jgi:DNA modification methylase
VGYKEKDLLMIPAQMALALRADGWFLRADIIWHKPNPMPESVRDRPTSAHEHVFLLTKRATYFYDAEAIAETAESFGRQHTSGEFSPKTAALKESGHHGKGGDLSINYERERRNARNVWTIATQPFSGAHFATMPPDLAERCIKAGTREGDTVLDPFGGAGTTGLVADRLNRSAILCELNPEYARLARERINGDAPLFAGAA